MAKTLFERTDIISAMRPWRTTRVQLNAAGAESHVAPVFVKCDFSHAALMGKYRGLGELLQQQVTTKVEFTFAQIDDVVPGGLPPSAHRHTAWWSNEADGTHSQARSWMSVGWLVERADLAARRVTFVRPQ